VKPARGDFLLWARGRPLVEFMNLVGGYGGFLKSVFGISMAENDLKVWGSFAGIVVFLAGMASLRSGTENLWIC
jgi:hypothetical protein